MTCHSNLKLEFAKYAAELYFEKPEITAREAIEKAKKEYERVVVDA
jgi:hypothetical protein